ncbi:MAG TPA: hypothetical protein DCL15_24530, partial [Chloroflexi bacterium]|nr:hypothetical protein [Chloroflexota bacterium]
MSVRVLPVPGPAATISGASVQRTAASCSGLRAWEMRRAGDWETGDWEIGDWEIGDWEIGDWRLG